MVIPAFRSLQHSASCSVLTAGSTHRSDQREQAIDWHLAEEVPVAFVYNTAPHAVMMATPADLEDFALGFSIAEEIITHPDATLLTKVEHHDAGVRLCIAVDPDHVGRGFAARRSMAGRTGCGMCGIEDLQNAVRKPKRLKTPVPHVGVEAIMHAFEQLPHNQPMNSVNKSVHAAAFCAPDGRILMAREDIGRHNALDKLIGAVHRAGLSPSLGFVAMTSRCSFELVQKACAAGIPLLATLSAPTALAVDLAERAGMSLAARAQSGTVVRFR
ncbi:formate dehydrogenase accessory sulfurtransferase FdhD [Magnetovibrio sp.]|uniref:formate dehydrogenase accessory sulfurtransferase FdhD n=1 Tax=Magnetovibrio sp. TaxID=2024836 RepID=UPI002F95D03E